jgi:hypothetical protein
MTQITLQTKGIRQRCIGYMAGATQEQSTTYRYSASVSADEQHRAPE